MTTSDYPATAGFSPLPPWKIILYRTQQCPRPDHVQEENDLPDTVFGGCIEFLGKFQCQFRGQMMNCLSHTCLHGHDMRISLQLAPAQLAGV